MAFPQREVSLKQKLTSRTRLKHSLVLENSVIVFDSHLDLVLFERLETFEGCGSFLLHAVRSTAFI